MEWPQFIQYAAPGSNFDGDMFDTVRAAYEGEERFKFDWPRLTWIMVFQFPVINAISTLITEVTEVEGTYCNGNFNPKFGYLWATVIQSITLGAAIAAIWRFYKRMTKRLRARRGLAKLVGFKALVGLIWTQQVLLSCFLLRDCWGKADESGRSSSASSSTTKCSSLARGSPTSISCTVYRV